MVQINELLGNKSIFAILNFFLENPSIQISQITLLRKLKISKGTAINSLRKLVKSELILLGKREVSNEYSLNKSHTLNKQLKILINLSKIISIKEIIDKDQAKIYLYGSRARGEDTEESDFDLIALGKIKKEDIIRQIKKLSDQLGAKINIEIFSKVDWAKMANKDPAFYERVEKDKIKL